MNKPVFHNKPNECVRTEDGRTVWLSRSCAVSVCVIGMDRKFGSPHILVSKRGPACPDYVGYYCMPCGYMDYNETSAQTAMREVWEETGVNIKDIPFCSDFNILYSDMIDTQNQNPWNVNTDPTANRQNITLHHGIAFTANKLPNLTNANNEVNGEVDEILWMPLQDFIGYKYIHDYNAKSSVPIEPKVPVCFNHEKRAWGFVREKLMPNIVDFVRAHQDMGVAINLPDWAFVLNDKTKNTLDSVPRFPPFES